MTATKKVRRQRGDGGLFWSESKSLWIARVDLGIGGDGKRRTREVSSVNYAKAAKKLKELRRAVEDHGDAPGDGMTVEAWLTYWIAEIVPGQVKPTTLGAYRSCVTQHLIPTIGKYRLGKLNGAHVRGLLKTLEARDLATSTILKAHVVLTKALKDAMREGKVTRNACELVQRPRLPDVDGISLTVEQVQAFMRANADHPLAPRWAVAFFTGERQGEILGLEWDRVDLQAGVADVSWQLQRLNYAHTCTTPCSAGRAGSCKSGPVLAVPAGFVHRRLEGGLCLTRPKSAKGKRMVPLIPFIVAALQAHRTTQGDNPHGLVFTRADGRPLDPRQDLDDWYAALQRAGLPRSGTHISRHTAAQLMRAAGTDRDVMKDVMGHTTAAVTSAYLHTDLTLMREAMQRLGDTLIAG